MDNYIEENYGLLYYSSTVHQVACPQPQSVPHIEYTVSIVNQQAHLVEFPQTDSGLVVPLFKQGDDSIDDINKMMSFLSTVVTSRTRSNTSGTGGNYSGQQRVVKCFNCQGEGHMERQCPKPKRKRDLASVVEIVLSFQWFHGLSLVLACQTLANIFNDDCLHVRPPIEFSLDPDTSCQNLVPSGRTSNALSIPRRDMTNALTRSGFIRSFQLKASATTFAFLGCTPQGEVLWSEKPRSANSCSWSDSSCISEGLICKVLGTIGAAPHLELNRFGILHGEPEEGRVASSGWPLVLAVPGLVTYLCQSDT
ncbi:retrovirus-related pol polyprotein from transposon TNT 1-94 [Tanacetum coccineum]|uniref:Retrovirus-related pol polyprotein from transposon TNT 1-94 n=1 Tax=Tanacetum coccineum TaxID=301880 RepID=A0ABQ5IPF9_9ASTR